MKINNKIKLLLEVVFERLAHGTRALAGLTHFALFVSQWGLKPTPQWFDHSIDRYWQWPKKRNSDWLERGFFNSLALDGGQALELTCGDGFYTSYFYAGKLEKIIACDRDQKAIRHALRRNKAENIDFAVADILHGMPPGEFSNVIWDFGFPWSDYFTTEQIKSVVVQIRSRLKMNGIFSGYLAVHAANRVQVVQEDIREISFANIDEIHQFLLKFFANVRVIETKSATRHNAYFYASDGIVPFMNGWDRMI
jgi:hypothetical protein